MIADWRLPISDWFVSRKSRIGNRERDTTAPGGLASKVWACPRPQNQGQDPNEWHSPDPSRPACGGAEPPPDIRRRSRIGHCVYLVLANGWSPPGFYVAMNAVSALNRLVRHNRFHSNSKETPVATAPGTDLTSQSDTNLLRRRSPGTASQRNSLRSTAHSCWA